MGEKQLSHLLCGGHARQNLLRPGQPQFLLGGFGFGQRLRNKFRQRLGFRLHFRLRLRFGGKGALQRRHCFTGNGLRLFQPQTAATGGKHRGKNQETCKVFSHNSPFWRKNPARNAPERDVIR